MHSLRVMLVLGLAVLAACGSDPEGNAETDAGPPEPASAPDYSELTADAETVERGRRLFSNCAVCHSVDKTKPSYGGPHLEAVLGRSIASVEGFPYTKALRSAEGRWSVEKLDQFITNPAESYPGTAMAFAGIADAADRAAIISYLALNSGR